MQTIELGNGMRFGLNEVLNSLRRLDTNSLEKITDDLNQVVELRKNTDTSKMEDDLIKAIKRKIPVSMLRQQRRLFSKFQNDTISENEVMELKNLINLLEQKNAERIWLMIELAKIRKVDFEEVRVQFIKPAL